MKSMFHRRRRHDADADCAEGECLHHNPSFAKGDGHHEHHRGERGRGHGRGRQMKLRRLFEQGDLHAGAIGAYPKKASHGYELIKLIEETTSRLYTPSPGVIYPTLTLLEEQGFIEPASTEDSRKNYQITSAGEQHLIASKMAVDIIFERIKGAGEKHVSHLAEEIEDAIHRLRGVLRHNLAGKELSQAQSKKIAKVLNDAIHDIETELQEGDANE